MATRNRRARMWIAAAALWAGCAARPAPPPGIQGSGIEVLVAEADGAPIAGARVEARARPAPAWSWHKAHFDGLLDAPPLLAESTDDGGRAVLAGLPEGEFSILVRAEGLADAALHGIPVGAGAHGTPLRFRLGPGQSLAGVLRGPEGNPIVGASILAMGPADGAPWTCPRTLTDDDGRWRLDGLAGGRIHLRAMPRWPGAEHSRLVLVPEVREYPFLLRKGRPIEGSVWDPATEKPVAGAVVLYTGHSHEGEMDCSAFATTDAGGRYRFEDIPSEVEEGGVRGPVLEDGRISGEQLFPSSTTFLTRDPWDPTCDPGGPQERSAKPPRTEASSNPAPPAGEPLRLSGRAIGAPGERPLAAVPVEWGHRGIHSPWTSVGVTDGEGRFDVAVPSATGFLRVRTPSPDIGEFPVVEGFPATGIEIRCIPPAPGPGQEPEPPADTEVSPFLPERTLRLRFVDGEDRPLGGLHLIADSETQPSRDGAPDEGHRWTDSAEDGTVVLRGLPPGRYSVRPSFLQDGPWIEERRFPGLETGREVHVLRLDGIELLVGRVVDEAGRAVAGTAVKATGPALSWSERVLRTDAIGSFRLRVLEGASCNLSVLPKDGRISRPLLDVRAGTDPVVLRLFPGGVIRGLVRDAEGNPLAGILVDATDHRHGAVQVGPNVWSRVGGYAPERKGTGITDAEGRFSISGLAPNGAFPVSAGGRPAPWASASVDGVKPGGADVVLTLTRGLEIRGRVLDPGGRPVAGATVNDSPEREGAVRTDAEGRFVLQGLESWRFPVGLFVHPAGTDLLAERAFPVASPAAEVEIRLRAPSCIRGIVVDEEGRPFGGAIVTAISGDLGYSQSWEWRAAGHAGAAPCDAAGRFRIDGLRGGLRFRLEVQRSRIHDDEEEPRVLADDVPAGAEGIRLVLPAK